MKIIDIIIVAIKHVSDNIENIKNPSALVQISLKSIFIMIM